MQSFGPKSLKALRNEISDAAWDGARDERREDGQIVRCDDAARRMLECVPTLELADGRALYAVESTDANGHGRVWTDDASGTDVAFDADVGMDLALDLAETAKSIGPHLRSDGSLRSHLHAALLLREFAAFRFKWHAVWWGHHSICTEWPPPVWRDEEDEWSWDTKKLDPDPPPVRALELPDGGVRTTFYSSTELGTHRFFRHVAEFEPDALAPEFTVDVLGRGRSGFIV